MINQTLNENLYGPTAHTELIAITAAAGSRGGKGMEDNVKMILYYGFLIAVMLPIFP